MALRQSSGVPQCNIVTRWPLATIALLCKQTTDNCRTHPPPNLPISQSIGYYLILIINHKSHPLILSSYGLSTIEIPLTLNLSLTEWIPQSIYCTPVGGGVSK